MGLLSGFGGYLPDWLPDDPNKKAAARAGLLNFGAALMGGQGNMGQILGNGLMAGSRGYGGAIQQAQKDQMEAAQMKILQNKDGREQRIQSIIGDAFGGSKPAGLPQNAAAALAQGSATGSPGPTVGNAARMDALPKIGGAQPGKFPLSLMQVSALKAAGGPDLSPEFKMAHEGFKREQGATYVGTDGSQESYAKLDNGMVQGPDGLISHASGYVDSMAQAEAAKAAAQEQAKAERELLDPTKFIGADGRPIADTRAGYIRKLGELPKVGAPRPQQKPAPVVAKAEFPVVTPTEQKSRDGDRLAILMDERARITNPVDLAAIDREIVGAGGKPSAPAPGALQTAAEAKAATGAVDTTLKAGQGLNENWIKETHNPVQADGKAARATLTQLETIKHVNFNTGWGAETKAGAANILASLGVKDAAKYASSAQQFQQVAMERNMTMLAAQVGPQTEGDSQRAQQTFVKLANTPAANQFIADLTGANARIAAAKADYYNKALPLAQKTGDLTEIDRRWSKIAPSVWADPLLAKYKGK